MPHALTGLGRPSDRLPALPEPSRTQLVLSAIWIAAAGLLLAALAVRIVDGLDLRRWWVPLAFLAGIVAADFGSGMVHWAADTWGRADLPVIGRRILVPFRVHHLNPDDFLRRGFLDTNGDVTALTVPVLAWLLIMPIDTAWREAVAVFGAALCAFGAMTNQIHQWAHMPSAPRAVRALQALRLVLRPRDHAAHHDRPFDAHYCITTGWCNAPLQAVGFFRGLEALIVCITGALPRGDERSSEARYGGANPAVAHDG